MSRSVFFFMTMRRQTDSSYLYIMALCEFCCTRCIRVSLLSHNGDLEIYRLSVFMQFFRVVIISI